MGKLVGLAVLLNQLECAFLQDNVQAFRHTLREAQLVMDTIPGEQVPIRDEQDLNQLDGPESWL